MAEVEYTGVFKNKSNQYQTKEITITITPNTKNRTQKLWDKFINKTSKHPVIAYNNWEIDNHKFEFKNPPWDDIEDLKDDLKELSSVTSAKIVNSATKREMIQIQTDGSLSIDQLREIVNDYYDGLKAKKNFNGNKLILTSPARHIKRD